MASIGIGSASSLAESAFETVDADSWSGTPAIEPKVAAPAAPSALTAACHEQPKLLSVVIPYHNLGAYIDETLDCVLASTYAPLEVVLVDDGSADPASRRALEAIEHRKLPQVRVVHTSNQGLAATRNTGAARARGAFLAFVDADDQVEPDFFARAIDVLQRYENVTLVYSWVRYFQKSSDIWPTWNAEFPYMLAHNMLVPLAVMRRSAFLQAARNKPAFEYNFEDYEGWLALVESGGVGVSLPHPFVRYRVRGGSMYHECGRNQQLYLYDLLTRYHEDAYREWGVELFNLQNANGPAWLWSQPSREPPEPTRETVTEMQKQRDKLWDEVQTLGKGWDDHVQYIKAQQLHIDNLENRCRELKTALDDFLGRDAISPRERQLGGRLVKRVRRTWLVRQMLRHTKLKQAIKRTIQKI
jgi:glycosyltransferase involved in cell wall biosynthesis